MLDHFNSINILCWIFFLFRCISQIIGPIIFATCRRVKKLESICGKSVIYRKNSMNKRGT